MSLYGTPTNRAEEFAELLERNYGLMLDPGRQQALCAAIEEFFGDGPMKNPYLPITGVDRSPSGQGQVAPAQFGPGERLETAEEARNAYPLTPVDNGPTYPFTGQFGPGKRPTTADEARNAAGQFGPGDRPDGEVRNAGQANPSGIAYPVGGQFGPGEHPNEARNAGHVGQFGPGEHLDTTNEVRNAGQVAPERVVPGQVATRQFGAAPVPNPLVPKAEGE